MGFLEQRIGATELDPTALRAGADTASLAEFARSEGLAYSASADLPAKGATLSRGTGQVAGAASGTLPGGAEGTLAYFTYSYRVSDGKHDLIEHQQLTLAVTEVPESIGFVPDLGFSRGSSHLEPTVGATGMRRVDLGGIAGLADSRCFIFAGTDENWQTRLFSPALLEWLARSEPDFGFELADGLLVVGRDGYLEDPRALAALCADAGHLASALRAEVEDAVAAGTAATSAARGPDSDPGEPGERVGDPRMEAALAAVDLPAPKTLDEADRAFRSYLRRSPRTLATSLGGAAWVGPLGSVLTVVPVMLAIAGAWPLLIAYELLAILVAFFFVHRWAVKEGAGRYASEAFFRAYAASRGLTLVEPLRFLATHTEAKLPFRPDRVLMGKLPRGINGALALVGDGTRRADRIAVVGGASGPVAEAELVASAPGISTADLDDYLQRLSDRLRIAPAPHQEKKSTESQRPEGK